jgi:hypothetical protein
MFGIKQFMEVSAMTHAKWAKTHDVPTDDTTLSGILLADIIVPPAELAEAAIGHREYKTLGDAVGYEFRNWTSYLHFLERWHRLSYPQFKLTESLATQLLLTDCSRLPTTDPDGSPTLHLPFNQFAILLPNEIDWLQLNDVEFSKEDREHGPQTNPEAVQLPDGRYTSPCRLLTFHRSRTFSQATLAEKYSQDRFTIEDLHNPKYEADLAWQVEIRVFSPSGTALHHRSKDFSYYATIEDWINLELSIPLEQHEIDTLHAAARLIANFALYLDSSSPVVKKAVQIHRRLPDGTRINPKSFLVGKTTPISPMLLSAAKATALGKRSNVSVELRYVVRGHWKNQPFGKGRSQRKRLWIQPYWKGPETLKTKPREYSVS